MAPLPPHAFRSHSQGSGGSARRIVRGTLVAGPCLSPDQDQLIVRETHYPASNA
jgi:hypothetical protein